MSLFVLNERARRFDAKAEDPWLSLKCMTRGEARYEVSGRILTVGNGQCLLLNEGTSYAITISSAEIVESFVVFFDPEWTRSAIRAHIEKDRCLLDEPFFTPNESFRFQEMLYPLDGGLAFAHRKLRRLHGFAKKEPLNQDEVAAELLAACVRRQSGFARETEKLKTQRRSTRLELQRRLQIARDFLQSNYSSRISLDEVARAACLSRFHLSRRFKELHGLAPMAYLQEIRMQRAINLLKTSRKSVLEICVSVGFESPTTFSTLVRSRTGLSPRALRKAAN